MKEELGINKEKLGINDWLELIKEDKNLNGAYISISQYIWLLEQENKQLKEQLLVAQTNEETFRLEMKDVTKALGLDENTIFDDVKVRVRNLKDNWNRLKQKMIDSFNKTQDVQFLDVLQVMQELERGSNYDK